MLHAFLPTASPPLGLNSCPWGNLGQGI